MQRNKLRKVLLKVKGKFYKTVIRPTMMYKSNAKRIQKEKINKNESCRNDNAKVDMPFD